MAASGVGNLGHTKVRIFTWATGTTLKAAMDTAIAARSTTWAAFTDAPASTLRMPAIFIRTPAADGTLGDGVATIPLTQNLTVGPFDLETPLSLTYTGSSSAVVMMYV